MFIKHIEGGNHRINSRIFTDYGCQNVLSKSKLMHIVQSKSKLIYSVFNHEFDNLAPNLNKIF
jgi:hypothetical protein